MAEKNNRFSGMSRAELEKEGFMVTDAKTVYYGVCPECLKKQR